MSYVECHSLSPLELKPIKRRRANGWFSVFLAKVLRGAEVGGLAETRGTLAVEVMIGYESIAGSLYVREVRSVTGAGGVMGAGSVASI